MQAAQKRINEELARCVEIARAKYGIDMPMPTVRIDITGTAAGMAMLTQNVIRLNAYLVKTKLEDILFDTVPHELAHLVHYKVHPEDFRGRKRNVHGDNWKRIMRSFGRAEPTRCHSHNIPVEARRTKAGSGVLKCVKCNHEYVIGKTRLTRFRSKPASYWCKCSGRPMSGTNLVEVNPVVATIAPTPTPAPVVKVTAAPVKSTSGKSKLDICREIYVKHRSAKSRAELINLFISEAGCTKAGASTYLYNLLKSNP